MKNILLTLVCCCSIGHSFAQFDIDPMAIIDKMIGNIESDRPGQALTPKTAGMLAIQLQTGFEYRRRDYDADVYQNWMLVPTNIRLGLTSKWELNTSFTYVKYSANWLSPAVITAKGFASPEIGVRYSFLNGDGWIPHLGAQANMSFLSHKGDFQQQQMGSSYYLISSNRFSAMSVNTNFGLFFPGNGNFAPSYPWVFNLGFSLGDKFSCFVEGFGEFKTLSISADAGIAYNPISDLQIDLFGGLREIDNSWNLWFAEIGVSYRFSVLRVLAKKKAGQFMDMMK